MSFPTFPWLNQQTKATQKQPATTEELAFEQQLFSFVITAYETGIKELQEVVRTDPHDPELAWKLSSSEGALARIKQNQINVPTKELYKIFSYTTDTKRENQSVITLGLPIFDEMVIGLWHRASIVGLGQEEGRRLVSYAALFTSARVSFWDTISEADKKAELSTSLSQREASFIRSDRVKRGENLRTPELEWEECKKIASRRLEALKILDPHILEQESRKLLLEGKNQELIHHLSEARKLARKIVKLMVDRGEYPEEFTLLAIAASQTNHDSHLSTLYASALKSAMDYFTQNPGIAPQLEEQTKSLLTSLNQPTPLTSNILIIS